MKKTLLILCMLTGLSGMLHAQNAFYDAQGFASITQAEIDLLNHGPTNPKQFSAEEITTISQAKLFLATPFADGIDRNYLNPKLLKKIIVKLNIEANPPRPAAFPGAAGSGYSGLMALPGVANTTLTGFGNTATRLGSADFQTMLIDATAKYLAQSFKEDVVYLYFSKLKQKLDENAACKYLIPNTSDVIKKIDPFNFKNLGDSWKAAFEKDIENMPLSFADYVRNNAANSAWCAKVGKTDYFKYYGYSVDILQPLLKGEHPVEILENIDQNNYHVPDEVGTGDQYKSFIHFLNILQFNLQDSTKKATDKQYENLWLSFSQLKELNTPLKLQYFFGLIYQQDPDFFHSDKMGIELATIIRQNANYTKIVNSLSQFLILLNQVEGNIKTITAARASGGAVTSFSPAYLKTVLGIADSANSFIKKITLISGNNHLGAMTAKIDVCLHYCDDAYKLYADITAKNYTGVIDDAGNLLAAIDEKDKVSINLVQTELGSTVAYAAQIKTIYDAYANAIGSAAGAPPDLAAFTGFVNASLVGQNANATAIKTSVKAAINYNALPAAIQTKVNNALNLIDPFVIDLNKLPVNQAAFAANYQAIFDEYTKAINGIAGAAITLPQLTGFVAENIHYTIVDPEGIKSSIRTALNYSAMTAKVQSDLDKAMKKIEDPVNALNKILEKANTSLQMTVFLKTIAIINKYGQVIAGVANAQNSDDLGNVIKNFVATSGSFSVQRNSLTTISIAAKVGGSFGLEGTDRWTQFRPNLGLTVPIGIEFTWGNRSDKKTDYPYLAHNGDIRYLTGASQGLFVQIFDIAAVVNYRLSADSSSSALPQKVLLSQVFSPGLTYNWGLKNCPFDIGFGAEYTPELRKIDSDPQANAVRLFIRICWDKPLFFLASRTEIKDAYKINSN